MTLLLEITKTKRFFGRNQEWFKYDVKHERFDTIKDARAWMRETYGNGKRQPIYVDTKSRGTFQTGWIFSSKDDDGYLQDWVSVNEIVSESNKEIRAFDVARKQKEVTH